jgi:hypothetical protein
MARRIAGPNANADALECARRVAEAQVDLNRVRGSRRRLITGLLTDPSRDRAPELAAFDRYQRRGLSRRKSAIRSFDARRCRE